ncbi:hypothetical protein [Actibacterium lipolyticum]|uniref:Uncharacterized protein n=1 Tax=Actibacterium lipolyticum TaxID=1524263 RepID=A0A238JWN9_9RHOB|nr:hypothetical protein [Actibacterium lipolyticum]SMX34617.1 hypothetical protein COL8621_01400 [Actibacterium lipolyticum]
MVGTIQRILSFVIGLVACLTFAASGRTEAAASFEIGDSYGRAYIIVADENGPYIMLTCDLGFRTENYADNDREENRLTEPPFSAYLRTERFFALNQVDDTLLRFRFRVGGKTYEAFASRLGAQYTFWTKVSLPFEGMRNLYKIKSSVDVFEILDLPGSEKFLVDFRSDPAQAVAERVSEMCRQEKQNRYEDYLAAAGTVIDARLTTWDGEPALALSFYREDSTLRFICQENTMPRVSFTPADVNFFRVDRAAAVYDFGMPEAEPLSSGALGLSFHIPSRSPGETSRIGNAATAIALARESTEDAGTWQMRVVRTEPEVLYEMLTGWDFVEVMSDVSIGASSGIARFALQGIRSSSIADLVKEHCAA